MKEINFIITNYKIEEESIEFFKNGNETIFRKIETPCEVNIYFEKTIYLKSEMYKIINDLLSHFLTMPFTEQTSINMKRSLMNKFDIAMSMNELFFEDDLFDTVKYNCIISSEPLYEIYKRRIRQNK